MKNTYAGKTICNAIIDFIPWAWKHHMYNLNRWCGLHVILIVVIASRGDVNVPSKFHALLSPIPICEWSDWQHTHPIYKYEIIWRKKKTKNMVHRIASMSIDGGKPFLFFYFCSSRNFKLYWFHGWMLLHMSLIDIPLKWGTKIAATRIKLLSMDWNYYDMRTDVDVLLCNLCLR